jgi:indoleamine 2,3-dioxygenase
MAMAQLTWLLGMMGLSSKAPPAPYTNGRIHVPDSSPDMSALARSEFGLDPVTGFLPPQVPLSRLPAMFDQWENALQLAMTVLNRPGDCEDPPATEKEKTQSREWREDVQCVRFLYFSVFQTIG